jgi:uncharacterized membrane protein YdjX (TVP38/TMEM64 family)
MGQSPLKSAHLGPLGSLTLQTGRRRVQFLARMPKLWRIIEDKRVRRTAVGMGLGLALALGMAWWLGVDFAGLHRAWKQLEHWLMLHPQALFWALVVLPGLPVPTSALLFAAGVVWRDRPLVACLLCILALLLNMIWTYWLAAKPGRHLVDRILAATRMRIPEIPYGDHLRMILILRLTPGMPLFFQNYVLGFLHAPFLLYLPVSLVCTGIMASGIVLSGAGLADGRMLPMLVGISLIVLAAVLTHMLRLWLAKRRYDKDLKIPE